MPGEQQRHQGDKQPRQEAERLLLDLGQRLDQRDGDAQRLAANVRHRSGMSTIKADADVSISRASIRIRRRTDVNAGMRVLFDGQVYEIDDVLPGESREYIDLVCRRIQGVQKT